MHNLEVPAGFLWGLPPKAGATTVATAALCAWGTPTPPRGWEPLACNRAQGHRLPPRPSAPPPGSHWPPSRTGDPRATPLDQCASRGKCEAGPAREGGGAAGPRLIRGGLVSGRAPVTKEARRPGLGSQGPFRKRGRTPREHGAAPRAKVAPALGGCTVASETVRRALGLPWRGGDRAQGPHSHLSSITCSTSYFGE